MQTTPLAAHPRALTITINPIIGGTDVIDAAHYAVPTPILFSGTEAGLDGQSVVVNATKDFGNDALQGLASTPAANGAWSTYADVDPHADNGGGGDGVYTLTAIAGPLTAPFATASETIILASLTTPFSSTS